jgi:hypothetical protein
MRPALDKISRLVAARDQGTISDSRLRSEAAGIAKSFVTNNSHLADQFFATSSHLLGYNAGVIPLDPTTEVEKRRLKFLQDSKQGNLVATMAAVEATGPNGNIDLDLYNRVVDEQFVQFLQIEAKAERINSQRELLLAQNNLDDEQDKALVEDLLPQLQTVEAQLYKTIRSDAFIDATTGDLMTILNGMKAQRDDLRAQAEEVGRLAGVSDSEFWDVSKATPNFDRAITFLEDRFKNISVLEEAMQSQGRISVMKTLERYGILGGISPDFMDQLITSHLASGAGGRADQLLTDLTTIEGNEALVTFGSWDPNTNTFSNVFLGALEAVNDGERAATVRSSFDIAKAQVDLAVNEAAAGSIRAQAVEAAVRGFEAIDGIMGESTIEAIFDKNFVDMWTRTMEVSTEDPIARGLQQTVVSNLDDAFTFNRQRILDKLGTSEGGVVRSFPEAQLGFNGTNWIVDFGLVAATPAAEALKGFMFQEGLPLTVEGLRAFSATNPAKTALEMSQLAGTERGIALSAARDILLAVDKPLKIVNKVEAISHELGLSGLQSSESAPVAAPKKKGPEAPIILSSEDDMGLYDSAPVGTHFSVWDPETNQWVSVVKQEERR